MEENKVDPMYMENLEEWILEENKVVTYKFLSRSLKVHVNVAKQMLFNFVETKKSSSTPLLGIVYLLSGMVENKDVEKSADDVTESSTLKVLLVKEKDLKDVLSKFSKVHSQHIYSVQLAEAVSQTSLYATDLEVFKEDPAGATALTAIKNKNAVPREAVRIPIEVKKEIKKEVKPEIKKEVKKTGIEGAFGKAKKLSPKKETGDVKEEKPKVTEKKDSKAAKKPGASNIANFFAKQAAKPKVEKTVIKDKTEIKNEEKENMVNQRIEDESTDTTKEDSSSKKEILKSPVKENRIPPKKAVKKTPPKKKSVKKDDDDSKKRKRIQVMSDSEDEADEKEEDGKIEEVIEEEAPPTSKLIESSDEEEIPPTPKQPTRTSKPGRKRVKRQVDKTYVDDQGYMVTKKEYESTSETDDEPEPVKEKTPKKVEKVEAPAAKKAKLVAPGSKSQAGIMSFFKKK